MIELYSANTPNGKKISPLSKIPVIIDHKNKKTVFESGAILIYLAELSGKFYNFEEVVNSNLYFSFGLASLKQALAASAPS